MAAKQPHLARAVASEVLEQLKSGCGIADQAAAVRAAQQVAGFAQHEIVGAGGFGTPDQVAALLYGAVKLMLGLRRNGDYVTYEEISEVLNRMVSIRAVRKDEGPAPRPKDHADIFIEALERGGLNKPGAEKAVYALIEDALKVLPAFGGQEHSLDDELLSVLYAAIVLVRARFELRGAEGARGELLAEIQRRLNVRAVPA